MLAQALIATNSKAVAEEAAELLRYAISREPDATEAYSQLAMAYGRKGDLANGRSRLGAAAFTRGDIVTARQLAGRAKTRLPVGRRPGCAPTTSSTSSRPAQQHPQTDHPQGPTR